ncbi:PREDICTED: uncharacterized protein LOC109156507 [Ipomoea nil]|uniref:uncharacterized protein LOC109156507 n=1 Tax=Ipomoea nil TaxID=35883 RepID=UPI0009010D71|nr:PREDICTED: uncharacterized protein LOC109156507 [Ipomoea nil]
MEWTVLQGLRLAAAWGTRNLIVESDSLDIIKRLSGSEYKARGVSNVIRLCGHELSRFHNIEFKHVRREQNRVADRLATMGTTHELGVRVLTDMPLIVEDVMWEDSVGARVTRGANH